jgi:carboxymethylenebutenolidase
MCDDRTHAENETHGAMSRRGFAAMSVAALAACAASPADARAVTEREVTIATPDGNCDAHFVHPARGRHAAVIVWPDILGLRPAFRVMGKRLAESGYAVLTVNPFYRVTPAPVAADWSAFADPAGRQRLIGMARSFTPATQTTDATAFVSWLDAQGAVDTRRKIGTTGYCMGGSFTMRTAAALPQRIGAGASFHGGGLASEAPDSPHLLIPRMQARFLIAIAQNDDTASPGVKDTLRQAFDAASRPAEIEVYPAQHGWCSIDSQAFDQAQADRAWGRLLALFEAGLG